MYFCHLVPGLSAAACEFQLVHLHYLCGIQRTHAPAVTNIKLHAHSALQPVVKLHDAARLDSTTAAAHHGQIEHARHDVSISEASV